MSWKHWKRGLLIAVLTGAATGALGLAIGITWTQAAILFGVSVAKDVLLYLKNHPFEKIVETSFLRKP